LGTKKATTSPIMGRCSRGATHISSLLQADKRICLSWRWASLACVSKEQDTSPLSGLYRCCALIRQKKTLPPLKGRNVSIRYATSVQNSLCGYGCYSIPRPFNGGLPVFATLFSHHVSEIHSPMATVSGFHCPGLALTNFRWILLLITDFISVILIHYNPFLIFVNR